MIAAEVVEEIQRLLLEGKLSQRQIARLTGVSRGSVGRIATGKRQDLPLPEREQIECPQWDQPPRRCPTCGGMVYMPCLLCSVQAERKKSRQDRPRPALAERSNPDLELTPDDRSRYEQMRERRSHGGPWVVELPRLFLESNGDGSVKAQPGATNQEVA